MQLVPLHLGVLWDLSYWTTFCLTWFVLPIHQVGSIKLLNSVVSYSA
jgi:hypothetical protein